MINNSNESDADFLRKKAEKLYKKQLPKTSSMLNEADSIKLIHELEVRQIELKMQNEELILAKKQAVIATDKYIELYDFAPAVYVTLSSSGKIARITQRGSLLLGMERSKLFYYDFEYFVTPETKPLFNDFFRRVFESGKQETCDVALITSNNSSIYVQIDSVISENGKHCYMSLLDITERILAERAMVIANIELIYQNQEKEKRAAELIVANEELAFQNQEKEKRAQELIIANKELIYQNHEKEKRAAELLVANEELAYQNQEKEKRAAELIVANEELAFQNQEKEKRAAELIVANEELAYQNQEKEKRAAELLVANKELAYQNQEKEKRAAELLVANKELAYQNQEKEKRAAELLVANEELAYQNQEKEKRAQELILINKELSMHIEEKERGQ
jgi:hypothetical protein